MLFQSWYFTFFPVTEEVQQGSTYFYNKSQSQNKSRSEVLKHAKAGIRVHHRISRTL